MEYEICIQCNGSGEGQYDGTTCSSCKGSGEVPAYEDEAEDYEDEEEYDDEL